MDFVSAHKQINKLINLYYVPILLPKKQQFSCEVEAFAEHLIFFTENVMLE